MSQLNTRDTSSKAVDASLAATYDTTLSASEQHLIREHLRYMLTVLRYDNAYTAPCREAVRVLDARFAGQKKWHEKPLGAVTLMVIGGFIGGLLVLFAGYKLRINGIDAPSPAQQVERK